MAGLSRERHRQYVGAAAVGRRRATRISSATAPTSSAAPSTGRPPAARPPRPGASRARPSATPTPTSSPSAAATTPARCAITADIARTSSKFDLQDRERRLRAQHQQFLGRLVHRHARTAPGRPSRCAASIRPTRRSTIIAASSRIMLTAKGDDWQARLDLEYEHGHRVPAEDPGGRPLRRPRRLEHRRRLLLEPARPQRSVQRGSARLSAVPLRPSTATTTSRSRSPGWRRPSTACGTI